MSNAPRLEYYGDAYKAASLKGKALGFYQSVLLSMGGVRTVTRDKQVGNAIIRVSVYTDAYDVVNGVIQIYAPSGGGNAIDPILFCTSFNDDNLGTQIYRNPYPPQTKGALIDVDNNPNNLILPQPTYGTGGKYWVDDKENNTVSWEYVTRNKEGGGTEEIGMVYINGVSGNLGVGVEPISVGLLSDTRMMAIIQVGEATTRSANILRYDIDNSSDFLNLENLSSLNIGANLYATHAIHGVLDDGCKTVIYSDDYEIKTFNLDIDIENDSINGVSDGLTINSTQAIVSDIRGNKVAFTSYSFISTTTIVGVAGSVPGLHGVHYLYEYNGITYVDVFRYTESGVYSFHVWDGVTHEDRILLTLNSNIDSIGNSSGTVKGTFYVINPLLYTAKNNILLYTITSYHEDSITIFPYAGLVSSKCELYAKNNRLLLSNSGIPIDDSQYVLPSNGYSLLDYCYTKEASILTFETAGDSMTIFYDKNSLKVVNTDTRNLSLTKLPKRSN